MKNKNKIFLVLAIFLIAFKALPQNNKGLVGLLYDDIRLTRISSVWYLEIVNSDEANWPAKNDFSAQWTGYLKLPVDKEISFFGEADNEMQLKINDQIIINSWNNAAILEGKFTAHKDSLYRVELRYSQINGASFMRIFWSWAGHPKEIIPQAAFSYDKEIETDMLGNFQSQINIDMTELEFDVESIVAINSAQDVIKKRTAVIRELWGLDGFPVGKQPPSSTKGINDSDFVSLNNLDRIDKLTIEMEFGLNSIVYHFNPVNANGSAAIYHQGHDGKFSAGFSTIAAFLEKGYHVFAMSMPLLGMNNKPVVDLDHFGKIILHSHNQMMLLTPLQGHPLKYFMEPVAAVTNYTQAFDFKRLIMIGISGGGWTTTLYSAIDTRIDISYPVAGTLPHYLRARDFVGNGSMGDYEQRSAQIYKRANYLELYIMASYGQNRRQLQILNEFDSCCFSGTGFKTYKDIIKKRVAQLGKGRYDIFLDSTHRQHQISPQALEIIFNDLETED